MIAYFYLFMVKIVAMETTHTPVLVEQILQFLEKQPLETFIDCTLGAGGHAQAILSSHQEIQAYYGLDQDPTAHKISKKNLNPWKNQLHHIHTNFEALSSLNLPKADGILADIGLSSMQLDTPDRGFSFRFEAPLDMRMDPTSQLTAANILNEWEERDLGILFRDYGEEKRWWKAAHAICERRKTAPITTTFQLNALLEPHLQRPRKGQIHPLTLIYQALRIAVNDELNRLEKFIQMAIQQLKPGGIIQIISFHRLEDRIVKNAFREAASDKVNTTGIGGVFLSKEPTMTLLNRRAISPTEEQIAKNPRCRSAKLRAAVRILRKA